MGLLLFVISLVVFWKIPTVWSPRYVKKGNKVVVNSAGAPQVNIGISTENRAAIAAELSKVLADSYTLYLMTHNFHWNVTGPLFNTLHVMFMTQYTEEWTALDDIAERI